MSKVRVAGFGVSIDAFGGDPDTLVSFTRSGRTGNQRLHTQASEGERRYLTGVPMGRFGEPGEIAAAIASLLSDDAAFVTRRHFSSTAARGSGGQHPDHGSGAACDSTGRSPL